MSEENKPLAEEIAEVVEPTEAQEVAPPTLAEAIERYERLKLLHPTLTIVMERGFREQATGGYPMYQQLLYAPFVVDHPERMALQAGIPITLTKAEWLRKDMTKYETRKAAAMTKLMDWVEAMVVPFKVGGEDQAKVLYWGHRRAEDEEGPKIELTDL